MKNLQTVLQQLTNINGQVETELAEGETNNLTTLLTNLTKQLTEIELNIQLIHQEESKLQQQLVTNQSDVTDNLESTKDEVNGQTVIEKIKQKELEILKSEYVTDGKKNRLQKIFQSPVRNVDEVLLLTYFESLVKYESVINVQLLDENNQLIDSKVNNILDMSQEEQAILNTLKDGTPIAQQHLATLKNDINTFFTSQLEVLEADYVAMSEQLDLIEQSVNNAKEQMNVLLSDAPGSKVEMQGPSLVTNQQSISQELEFIKGSMNTLVDNQDNLMAVTNELQMKAQGVNGDTLLLNNKWNENVKTTQLYRNDIHAILSGAFVDGQKNGQIYEYLSTPLAPNSLDQTIKQENKMPPVIILAIVLISGLMIGYFCYYFKQNQLLVRMALFVLLNLIVGLIISIYGLDIYPLSEQRAIEWTIFTVLLLTVVSALIFASFSIHNLIGWFVTVAVMAFFITPMLTLLATNIDYEDPMSKVYLSIQYGSESLLIPAVIILAFILAFTAVIPAFIKHLNKDSVIDEEASAEV